MSKQTYLFVHYYSPNRRLSKEDYFEEVFESTCRPEFGLDAGASLISVEAEGPMILLDTMALVHQCADDGVDGMQPLDQYRVRHWKFTDRDGGCGILVRAAYAPDAAKAKAREQTDEEIRDAVRQAVRDVSTSTSPPPAEDAKSLQSLITTRCGVYDDGSGDVKNRSARKLFDSFEIESCRGILEAAQVIDLNNLVRVLGNVAQTMSEAAPASLGDLRDCVREVIHNKARVTAANLPTVTSGEELHSQLVAAAGLSEYGGGHPDDETIGLLFRDLDPDGYDCVLSESTIATLGNLTAVLVRFAKPSQTPPPAALTQFVKSVAAQLRHKLQGGAKADDGSLKRFDELHTMITYCCGVNWDGYGVLNRDVAEILLDGWDASHFKPLFETAHPKGLVDFDKALSRIEQELSSPTPSALPSLRRQAREQIDQRTSGIDEAIAKVRNADELREIITSACGVYRDGSGKPDVEAVQRINQSLSPELCEKPISCSKGESIRELTTALERVRNSLGSPHPDNIGAVLDAIPQILERYARKMLKDIPHVKDAAQLNTAITQTCGVYEDGSGAANLAAANVLFSALDPRAFKDVLIKSSVESLQNLYAALGNVSKSLESEPQRNALHLRRIVGSAKSPLRQFIQLVKVLRYGTE